MFHFGFTIVQFFSDFLAIWTLYFGLGKCLCLYRYGVPTPSLVHYWWCLTALCYKVSYTLVISLLKRYFSDFSEVVVSELWSI